jgi:hypothetical protein
MTTQPPFSQHEPIDTWADLDAELARWLRMRTALRAKRPREDSSLDGMAMALRRVRVSLEAMGDSAASSATGERDPRIVNLVSQGYRWAIRVARELDTIEQLALDSGREWTRFEAFAPAALALFDTTVAGPFAAAPRSMDVARLERDIDAVMAPVSIALMSSAWAA